MPERKENLEEAPQAEPVSEVTASDESPENGSYYYDDSHGYEDFDPEDDQEEGA